MKPLRLCRGAVLWTALAAVSFGALAAQTALLWGRPGKYRFPARPAVAPGPDARPHVAAREGSIRVADRADETQLDDALVAAVIEIESGGDPRRTGGAGERGIMQIKRQTWDNVTRRLWGEALPWDLAFDPVLNRQVGKAYLQELRTFLARHRPVWRSDERSLLLACYNAGPRRVAEAGFDLTRLPEAVQSYVERASALHDLFLAEGVPYSEAFQVSLAGSRSSVAQRS